MRRRPSTVSSPGSSPAAWRRGSDRRLPEPAPRLAFLALLVTAAAAILRLARSALAVEP
jgi:hypothetical protein